MSLANINKDAQIDQSLAFVQTGQTSQLVLQDSLTISRMQDSPHLALDEGRLILDHSVMQPRQIVQGLYGAKAKAVSAEIFELRMELITDQTTEKWHQFTRLAGHFSQGLLLDLCRVASGDKKYSEQLLEMTGFTREEFDEYIALMKRNGYDTHHKREILAQNESGSCVTYTSAGSYIIYASKSNQFSIKDLPLLDDSKNCTLKQFMEMYKDIIMVVGSSRFHSDEPYYQNMGIFRNPTQAIEGGYKNIGMILHGFSGAVVESFFPSKKEMMVVPIASMQAMICNTFKPGEYRIEGASEVDLAKVKEVANRQLRNISSGAYPPNFIQISALRDLFYQNH